MLQQNVNNPKKEKSFYRYGVQYSSHIPDTTGTAKPDLNGSEINIFQKNKDHFVIPTNQGDHVLAEYAYAFT